MTETATVNGCPCGAVHEMDSATWTAFANVTESVDPLITVTIPQGSWLVPRLFIACHGLKAAELPALAERYGFGETAP